MTAPTDPTEPGARQQHAEADELAEAIVAAIEGRMLP
jgi:hypothetical protein